MRRYEMSLPIYLFEDPSIQLKLLKLSKFLIFFWVNSNQYIDCLWNVFFLVAGSQYRLYIKPSNWSRSSCHCSVAWNIKPSHCWKLGELDIVYLSLLERAIFCVWNACITKFYMFHCRSMLLGIELSQILFASHSAWDGTYYLTTMLFLYYAILMISCTISNSAHFQESYMCILKKAHEWWPWTFRAEEKSKYPKLERDGFAFKVPKLLFSYLPGQKLGHENYFLKLGPGYIYRCWFFVIYNVVIQ